MMRLTLSATACAITTLLLTAGCSQDQSDLLRSSKDHTYPSVPVSLPETAGQQPIQVEKVSAEAITDLSTMNVQPQFVAEIRADATRSAKRAPAVWAQTLSEYPPGDWPVSAPVYEGETYAQLSRNGTIQTQAQPVSTFSIDVDTGAYSNVRRFLQNGQLPPADAVRVEEMLNYFSYDYRVPTDATEPFSVTTELGRTPWNANTSLLHIGLKGYAPPHSASKPANLVFLIDVSGSMDSPDKLGLLKASISLLAQQLDADDTVSIAVYAGSSGTVLEPTPGNRHHDIDRALTRLTAGGSTNGAEGIELAYELASKQFRPEGINRVILATDGDFNVGISDVDKLKDLIRIKRDSGIALTTLGFGTGNYNDHLMEQLADVGNGSYAYIDTLGEARKVLVEELQATLLTIASDVKVQVEFNPAVVSEYRLIGYSNRALANEDFNNDRVDAGEIGAGHTVTALYEIALRGEGGERHSPQRYGSPADPETVDSDETANAGTHPSEAAEVRLRYKLPGSSSSRLISEVVTRGTSGADEFTHSTGTDDFRFSASVAAFAQLLNGDSRLDAFNYQDARDLAVTALGTDTFGYRAEFIRLMDMASSLDRLSRLVNTLTPADEG